MARKTAATGAVVSRRVIVGSPVYMVLLEEQRAKMAKLKSSVFRSYHLEAINPQDVNEWELRCKTCNRKYSHRRGAGASSTSTLMYHIKKHAKVEQKERPALRGTNFYAKSQLELHVGILYLLCKDHLSLNTVSSKGLRALLKIAN